MDWLETCCGRPEEFVGLFDDLGLREVPPQDVIGVPSVLYCG